MGYASVWFVVKIVSDAKVTIMLFSLTSIQSGARNYDQNCIRLHHGYCCFNKVIHVYPWLNDSSCAGFVLLCATDAYAT